MDTTKIIQLFPEIAAATSKASTFDEAMQICINKVCLHTGWDVGHVYLPDSKGSLFSTKLWFFRDPGKFETFRKITDKTIFTKGVGLIGKVFAKGKLLWIEDVNREPYFLRTKSGKDINVRFGFAFPVIVDKKTVAVLEFFAEKSLRPDEYFLEAISTISSHLAWVYERKKSELALQSSHDYLQKLNDSLGDAILTVKIPERTIEYANLTAESIFGYKPDECIGKKTEMFYSEEEEYHDFGRLLKNAMQEGKKELRVEKLLKRKNGEIFPCEITTTFLKENEKIVRVISILHDITERKQVEKSLSDYKQQLYAFSLATTNMLWNWDLINNTVERNIGFEKAFGYTKEEIVPNIEWWIDRLHPDDRVKVLSIYENAVNKGHSTCSYEYRFRLSDGNYSYISDNVYIVRDENGKAIRSIGAMTDITKRKEAEEMQQKHSKILEQKNIALTEVLSHIEFEKKQIKDNVIANAEALLLPIIEKIRLNGESRQYANLLEKSLKELTSSFGVKLTKKEAKLTPREIEICNMIKNGLASIEIADLFNISLRTIEKHRAHIRKKLGISNKEANLISFLKTL